MFESARKAIITAAALIPIVPLAAHAAKLQPPVTFDGGVPDLVSESITLNADGTYVFAIHHESIAGPRGSETRRGRWTFDSTASVVTLHSDDVRDPDAVMRISAGRRLTATVESPRDGLSVALEAEVPAPPSIASRIKTQSRAEGLAVTDKTPTEHIYVRPGADLARYRNLMIDAVNVEIGLGEYYDRTSPRDRAALQQRLNVYADEIGKDVRRRWLALVAPTYALVEHKDAETVRVSVRILGIVLDTPLEGAANRGTEFAFANGSRAIQVLEVHNAMTDELLVRLLNDGPTAQGPGIMLIGHLPGKAAPADLYSRWASALGDELLDAVGTLAAR
jgi:hypothetical protein